MSKPKGLLRQAISHSPEVLGMDCIRNPEEALQQLVGFERRKHYKERSCTEEEALSLARLIL